MPAVQKYFTDEERRLARNAAARRWRAKLSGEDRAELYRRQNLMAKYGISMDQWDDMLQAQGGGCAICGRRKKLYVDHDHSTGAVRALLCRNCNVGIGHFYDDADVLMAAVAYLLQFDDVLSGTAQDTEDVDPTELSKEIS